MTQHLLSCSDLHISFTLPDDRIAEAVRGVSFSLDETETLGIVGESGCGKTVTALAVMRLVPPPGMISAGSIFFDGSDLLSLSEQQMRTIRGRRISMIFQDPMTSLNPVYTCRSQIKEAIVHHDIARPSEADTIIESILAEVGIPDPKRTADSYPHQLSGGMRQRVMIAMALSCNPRLLIADEPTTALDVTVQARILDLLHGLQSKKNMSMILITHNLGIVGDIADAVIVMYAGEVMEYATLRELFDRPMHPYTVNLLETIPALDARKERLTVIPGEVPTLRNIPPGCPFHPRCNRAMPRCAVEHPALSSLENGHQVRCLLYA
ncbi:MAG: ABC transporter ATP-binding protein [Chitinispirillaceae bacterium]|nr:ABC transporter ATP-binding protein [Chitinispirillaceae bacterium]